MKKIIFGKRFRFDCEPQYLDSLRESVKLYEDGTDEGRVDVEVFIRQKIHPEHIQAVNPKVHKKTASGMFIAYPQADIYWCYSSEGELRVELAIKQLSKFRSAIRKVRSMEFPKSVETFEQVLHELILVPSVYFFPDIAPVHAACISTNGHACLLAGTGGVGKSSAMLANRRNSDVGFVSDDIAIVSADSTVYGNMGWAKIYGYNCCGTEIKQEILAGRGWLDALHFNVRNHFNPAGVRRKIAPDRLYRHYESGAVNLASLYYLVREDVSKIELSPLALDDAVEMTVAVMTAEYSQFHNHLQWQHYNAIAIGVEAMLTIKQVVLNWRHVLKKCFSAVALYKVSIPLEIDHSTYLQQIQDITLGQRGL